MIRTQIRGIFLAVLVVSAVTPAWAQLFRNQGGGGLRLEGLAGRSLGAGGGIRAEAIVGRPFGVGRIEVDIPPASQPDPLGLPGVGISARDGRVLYPAIVAPQGAEVAKEVLEQIDRPITRIIGGFLPPSGKATVFFLFRGDGPLEITLRTKKAQTFSVQPVGSPAAWQQLMGQWWEAYSAARPLLIHAAEYPPMVENYLQSMLARRLSLTMPPTRESGMDMLERELGLLVNSELLRVRMRQARMLGTAPLNEQATLPLPAPLPPAALPIPDVPETVAVEPIAMRVPEECLYVRFGNYGNFMWFQDTLARWNDDLRNLVARRALAEHQSARMQDQICLHQNALARLLGPTVIADAAIVGSDPFLADGAAIGILFQAKNNYLLANDFSRQRQDAIKNGKNVTESKRTIAGKSVSFLSSPDGTVRSFYAADGDFHFVTTSETLARRFLETGQKKGSLGVSKEFRYARSLMPTTRNDTVFVYLSAAFFRNLTSPHYRIETQRRLQAAADIELVQMAQLISATEGMPGGEFKNLIAGGFLPAEFGARPDGSQTVIEERRIYDSLRGDRGAMVPVPDVAVEKVTPSEAESYRRFAAVYGERWGQMEPLIVGLKRESVDDGKRDRISVDLQMTPLNPKQTSLLSSQLGQADSKRTARLDANQIEGEWIAPSQRIVFGLVDHAPTPQMTDAAARTVSASLLLPFGRIRDYLKGYVGYTGEDSGILGWLNRRPFMQTDASGFSQSPLDLYWRLNYGPYTLFSFHREVLAAVAPQLRLEDAQQPAQIRLRVKDLSQAALAPLINRMAFERSKQTSLGNLRLLHAMTEQFHLPGDAAKDAAEVLLGSQLIDPLGGQFVFRDSGQGTAYWTTTSLESQTPSNAGAMPQLAPPLNWFHGLDLNVLLNDNRLVVHAVVDMLLPATQKPAAK